MRILHIAQRYLPALGGAERYLHELSSRLVAEGHQVTVITTDSLDFELFWDPSCRRVRERESYYEGVRVIRLPVSHVPMPQLAYPAIRRLLWLMSQVSVIPTGLMWKLARYTPWVPALWKWIEEDQGHYDIVGGMTICFEPLLEAGRRFAKRIGAPFVVYPLTHLGAGHRPGQDSLSRFYTMRHQVELVKRSDAVVAQTTTEKKFYVEQGLLPRRIVVAGVGVNPQDLLGGEGSRFRQRYKVESHLVASVTKLSYDKGVFHLVEAIQRLRRSGIAVSLALAGDILSPFRRFWKQLSDADKQGVILLGRISEEEKRDLLAACDVFAMPSRTDSFGIAYLEAWLYKKPVIAAKTWGVTDIVEHEKNGLVVQFGDVDALASAILRLVKHPEQRAALGENGFQRVLSEHTWDHKYPMIRNLYLELSSR